MLLHAEELQSLQLFFMIQAVSLHVGLLADIESSLRILFLIRFFHLSNWTGHIVMKKVLVLTHFTLLLYYVLYLCQLQRVHFIIRP